ncbi:Fic family protein [Salinisphaera orenii]|uniref:Cell filamentation protein Fic n=1 Tax=Salinisphaera orenii YIM 95161 TaxID=1051139 RepID=A0A423PE92_9GAMM|nr:Fic family protein [Salinisphaera halophila]ROO23876.1 cell filamentation protein Fic [Salinisphaera halophila YIM 95161]
MTDLTYGLAPWMPSDPSRELASRAYQLAQKSAALSGLPAATRGALQDMLRMVNTYYSNLIEGQNTHPVEVDRAVRAGEQMQTPGVMISLALREAQQIIAARDEAGSHERPTDPDFIRRIHQLIFETAPESERRISDSNGNQSVVVRPGELRTTDVRVARHVAISHDQLSAALACFADAYRPDRASLRGDQGLIAAAAAHHRLAFLHPFVDGNGRVARLFSEVYIDCVLEQPAIWSLSRGLARARQRYYSHLADADAPRQGALDGRGQRSERALYAFCKFFLDTCVDQVDYMADVLGIEGYKRRVEYLVRQASERALPDVPALDRGAEGVLKAAFIEGELTRAEAGRRTGYKERMGRQVVSELLKEGLLVSSNQRGPVRPAFPATYLDYLFPKMAGLVN